MRDAVENVGLMQKQLNELQIENQLLKSILDRSGISYMQELRHLREPESTESFDPNQGARIRHPQEITEKMVNIYHAAALSTGGSIYDIPGTEPHKFNIGKALMVITNKPLLQAKVQSSISLVKPAPLESGKSDAVLKNTLTKPESSYIVAL